MTDVVKLAGAMYGMDNIDRDIRQERIAQEEKFPDQHLCDGTGKGLWRNKANTQKILNDAYGKAGSLTWQHVLEEEVLEAFAEKDPKLLRAELVQVAAVCVRWIQDIDGAREVSQT